MTSTMRAVVGLLGAVLVLAGLFGGTMSLPSEVHALDQCMTFTPTPSITPTPTATPEPGNSTLCGGVVCGGIVQ